MNTDFRVSISTVSHPKIIKLIRRCGHEAFYNLVRLWTFTAQNKPTGVLSGVDAEDVEIAADWRGEPGVFFQTLIELRLLDITETGEVAIHDWQEHNGYASYAEERSAQAREAARARWDKKRHGSDAPHDADLCVHDAPHDADYANSNAPDPSPDPSPDPALTAKDSCAEVSQATPAAPEPAAKQSALSEDPEPEALPPALPNLEPALLRFPLAGKAGEFPITQADVNEWQESFPGVDVLQALKVCLQWNRDNPKRRKTRSGIRKHISGWLAREQNRSRAAPVLPGGQTWVQNQPMTANQRYMMEVAELLTNGDTHALANTDSQRTQDTARALPGSWS